MKPLHILTLFLVLFTVRVWADAYIPPDKPQSTIIRTANGNPLHISKTIGSSTLTVNPSAGAVIKIPKAQFEGATKTGTAYTATKTNPATFTGSYGEKAAGTIRTQTTIPQQSALTKGFGALAVGAMATSHHQSLQRQGVAEQISRGFSDGDWGAVAAGIGKAFDWTGIGSIYAQALYGNPEIQQQVINPMREQALAQAQQQFQAHQQRQQLNPDDFKSYKIATLQAWTPATSSNNKVLIAKVAVPASFNQGFQRQAKDVAFVVTLDGVNYSIPDIGRPGDPTWVSLSFKQATRQDIIDINAQNVPAPDSFMPTEAQWAEAMDKFLTSGRATNDALRDLINAIWANGGLNPNNTQTLVMGGDAGNTYLSAPYTPVGSQTAQQTKFIVHSDGTVSSQIVQRPDLGAHTSQAPTRQEVGVPAKTEAAAPNPAKENPTAETPDVCKANPNSIMCADVGNADYEDLKLPTEQLDFNFEPADIFSSNGSCPPPKVISLFGSSYQFTYQPMCDFATGARPMIILVGMVIAMMMAYSAVKEL